MGRKRKVTINVTQTFVGNVDPDSIARAFAAEAPELLAEAPNDQPATQVADSQSSATEAPIEPPAGKRTYEVVEDKSIVNGFSTTKIRKGKQIICHPDDPYLVELLRQRVILREVK
jgi:hypothetical protein